jgi:hypothetical protein
MGKTIHGELDGVFGLAVNVGTQKFQRTPRFTALLFWCDAMSAL